MAAYNARSNVCTSGATYCGLYTRGIAIYVGGTDRTRQIEQAWSVNYALDAESGRGDFVTRKFSPTKYHEVVIYDGGTAGVQKWRGRVLTVAARAANWKQAPTYRLTCQDDRWLLDRYARVTKQYRARGANAIVADLIASFTDGSFHVGYIPSSLGNIDAIDFSNEPVSQAITRVAKAVSATWVLDPERYVSMVTSTIPDGNALTLTDGVRGYWDLTVTEDVQQARTRVFYEGGGSRTYQASDPGTTVIAVEDCSLFGGSGGTVRVGQNVVTYTAKSANSGQGGLTGCSGITYAIAIGDTVTVLTQTDDATAQTAVAAALGGGLSGVIVDVQSDGRLSMVECQGQAGLDIALFANGITSLDYTTDNEFTQVGKQVSATLTKPRTVSASFLIRAVTIRLHPKSPTELEYAVRAAPYRRTLSDLLVSRQRAS